MKRDDMLLRISQYVDGELDAADEATVEQLLGSHPVAREFSDGIGELRQMLRYEPVDDAPDLVPHVLERLPSRRKQNPWLRVAAVFVVGMVAGAAFIGLRSAGDPSLVAATIPERILQAQTRIDSMTASIQVTEYGWHSEVPIRTYEGAISYRAPEQLAVEITDRTEYPGPRWVANDTTLVVADSRSWTVGPAGCPTDALPNCAPPQPRVSSLSGRSPFPELSPAPLDLIVPVASFSRGGDPIVLGVQNINGTPAVGVEISVAQAGPLLDGLLGAGNWRPLHPTDTVELWLSEEWLTPVRLVATAAGGEDRALWALRHGLTDSAGDLILEIDWADVRIGALAAPPAPPSEDPVDAGFRDGPVPPMPLTYLPAGMVAHRSGSDGIRHVRSWSSGRAWLRMTWTETWSGDRLFGDLGTPVRLVELTDSVVYIAEDGTVVAMHADGVDVTIAGSVALDELLAVATGLDVSGVKVPDHWVESTAKTIAMARALLPGLLVPNGAGFDVPAVDAGAGLVVMGYAGPGAVGFSTVQLEGQLSPPMEADIRGVAVRGSEGRWSPGLGRLEWQENGLAITITSITMTLAELLDIAASMQ